MTAMRFSRWKQGVGCVVAVAAVSPVVAVAAQASATTVRPKLVSTTVSQFKTPPEMGVGVTFKVPRADYTSPAKAVICVRALCKTDVIETTSRPAAGATATEYTPNVIFKVNEAKLEVAVKTTLVLGAERYTYTSEAKDTPSPCVVLGGSRSMSLRPDC